MDGQWNSVGHFPEDQPPGTPFKGKKSQQLSSASSEELRDAAYDLLLDGGTRHQIIRAIHKQFYKNTIQDCEAAYYDAAAFLKQEQIETREILLDVLQASRLSGIQKALKRGQMMAAAALMRDAGAVIGESEREQQSTAVELKLTVQPPVEGLNPGTSDPIDVQPVEPEEQKELPESKGPSRVQGELFD